MTMTEFTIIRGLPGSGKTTKAKQLVTNSITPIIYVERDKIRTQLFNISGKARLTSDQEDQVSKEQRHLIKTALSNGISVVESSTNLPNRSVKDLMNLAVKANPKVDIHTIDLRNVSLEDLKVRNVNRTSGAQVPEEVIDSMYERYIKGKKLTNPEPPSPQEEESISVDPYLRPESGLPTIIFDVDGTLASHHGVRGPYDTSKYRQDTPHEDVIDIARALKKAGYGIIVLSGRHVDFQEDLGWWLDKHDMPYDRIIMRERHQVADHIEKVHLFNKYLRHDSSVSIHSVFDDRDRVVTDCWRNALKIRCFQVAPGDF